MNSRELALLEKAFDAEVNAALTKGVHLMQTKSKLADKLVNEGFLRKTEMRVGHSPWPCTVSGYELTHAGRLAYCAQC